MKYGMAKIMRIQLIVFLMTWVCLMVRPSWATTAYVTDFFEITLRSGPSVDNKVSAMIHTGQPVEIVKAREGWSYVRLLNRESGEKMGWVLSRFLVDRLPWKTRVREMKEENARLREKLLERERKLSEVLHRQKDGRASVNTMRKTVQRLTEENQRLKSSQRYRWFAIGAIVLLFGMIIGMVIGRKNRSRTFY